MKGTLKLPRGGLRLRSRKDFVKNLPIYNAALPTLAVVPLKEGEEEIECLVQAGDKVQEGMLIGKGTGPIPIHVHSPIPGTVREIRTVPLPQGLEGKAVLIELGGEFDRLGKKEAVYPWKGLSPKEIKTLLVEKGIAGRGFRLEGPVDLLIINGVETEPYLCSEYRLLLEKAKPLIEGTRILQKLLSPRRTFFVLSESNPDALSFLEQGTGEGGGEGPEIDFALAEDKHPAGDPEHLVRLVLGAKETGEPEAGQGSAALFDIATTFAVYEGIVLRKPLMERVVTVHGKAIRRPAILKVRIGTPVMDLIQECGGLLSPPAKVICNGPFRGHAIFDLRTPVTKSMSGLLFLTKDEIQAGSRTPCINCGQCVNVCPEGLNPTKLFKWIEHGYFQEALEESLKDCTECGCCAFVCPSRIPLAQGLHVGKLHAAKFFSPRG